MKVSAASASTRYRAKRPSDSHASVVRQAPMHASLNRDDRADDERERDADRRRVAHLLVGERVRVHVEHDREGATQRAAAGHHVRLDEQLEAVDRRERHDEDRLRQEQRQREMPEALPRRRAVELDRLLAASRDVLKSRRDR